MVEKIDSEITPERFLSVINKTPDRICLVDFYADWCEPCKWLSDLLDEIIPELSGTTRIIKIDIDKSPDVKSYFQINSVPVLILFKKGKVVWRINGFLSGPELKKKIESFSD